MMLRRNLAWQRKVVLAVALVIIVGVLGSVLGRADVTAVTVSGPNFPAFTTVRSLTVGRIHVLPSPAPSTNAEGSFTASIVVPSLEVGTQPVSAEVRNTTALFL